MNRADRDFDVILWGATGFTGRLVAEYLSARYPSGLKWAMGGRSEEKLRAVRDEIGAKETPLIVADASDAASLKKLAARTKVVATTVGPYQLYGSDLVAACAESGTDYVDLCGEPAWMRAMIDAHEARAKATGARIVFSCGFDSIPFDLGVLFIEEIAKREWGAPAPEVKGRVKAMKGGLSGGTAASLLASVDAAKNDEAVRRTLRDPYALAPDDKAKRPRQPSGHNAAYDADAKAWTAPFVMADINTRNVHRSNMLMGYAYGEGFLYTEMMIVSNAAAASMVAGGLAAFLAAAAFSPTRALLKRFALPSPGEGPDAEAREKGFYNILFIAKAADGRTLRARVKGDRDPGYGSTSKMLGESAVFMAKEAKGPGGFWTPASAMGTPLIERLQKSAGLSFERLTAM
ncbi:MAG: saccharopine dehydrogenase NADP-binding domain-containing protein [Parvularculaceae bacterium]